MTTINFNTHDHNFCESSIYGDSIHPEYFNALSSLVMTFFGFIGIIQHPISSLLIIFYSTLIINGVTSCLYHLYNSIGWGLMDRVSMVLVAMSSISLFINHIHFILVLQQWKNVKLIFNIINLFIIIYFTTLFTIIGLHMEILFNIMFGIFLASLYILLFLITKYYYKLKIPYMLILLGWKGVNYILVSGLFWIITESLCHKLFIIKYLMGHVFWHIFVSYGGYIISLIPYYMYLQDNNMIYSIKVVYKYYYIPYLKIDYELDR